MYLLEPLNDARSAVKAVFFSFLLSINKEKPCWILVPGLCPNIYIIYTEITRHFVPDVTYPPPYGRLKQHYKFIAGYLK